MVSKLNEKDLKINELEAKVKVLEDKCMFQENCYKLLERKIADGEQYQRRRSLRGGFFLCIFCPGTMKTHAESINSDLQRGLDRRLRHTQH